MTSDLPVPPGANSIAEEHTRIRELLQRILSAPDPGALLKLLEELHALLEDHFRHEEEDGGFVEVIRTEAPRLMGRTQALLHEHGLILAESLGLMAQGRAVLESMDEFVAGAKQLNDRITSHDEAENALLCEAVLDDIGTGD